MVGFNSGMTYFEDEGGEGWSGMEWKRGMTMEEGGVGRYDSF